MRAITQHLPNVVTASRGLGGFVVAGLLLTGWHRAAFFAYILATSTDLVDGWLARRLNAQSEAGVWLDPLSDRVLAGLTWISLWSIGWCPTWLVAPIFARNALAGVGWWMLRSRGTVIKATLTGRVMASFEAVAMPLLLFHDEWLHVHWASVGVLLGLITLALSLASGAQYALSARQT